MSRISGTACNECHTKQSVFASVDARDAHGATGRASLCADCAQKYDKDLVVRVGAPCWHSCELPDGFSRISEPLGDGEGLVVVTVDGPTTRPAKPVEVKLERCAPPLFSGHGVSGRRIAHSSREGNDTTAASRVRIRTPVGTYAAVRIHISRGGIEGPI
jgi:hypothetical protein